jgi:HSP20 family protein
MDLVKKGESYELTTDLPGVDPKSIDVDIDNGVLTISALKDCRCIFGVLVVWMRGT